MISKQLDGMHPASADDNRGRLLARPTSTGVSRPRARHDPDERPLQPQRPSSSRSTHAMKRRLLVAVLAALAFCGADVARAYVSANTIDGHATYTRDGTRVRATGPIGCTRGERISISIMRTMV